MKRYLVFDWGGTSLKYAYMSEDGQIIQKNSVSSPARSSTKEEFYAILDSVVNQYDDIDGIAISSSGVIDSENGVVDVIGAFPFLNGVCVAKELSQRYNTKVTIENDGKCAALAELWVGNLKDVDDGAVIVIGTNIGCALILNHKLRRGKRFLCGELCACSTDDQHLDDPYSYAGQHGTPYLCKIMQEKMGLDDGMDGVEAFNYINNKDPKALEALKEYTDSLAMMLFNINILLDLEKILIGGGISAQSVLLDSLKKSIRDIATYHVDIVKGTSYPLPVIDVCRFHNEANLLGALYHFMFE